VDGDFVCSPVDQHFDDWSVAAKRSLGRLFRRSSASRAQLSSLSILRCSSTWFIRTLSFSRCSQNYRKGLRLR
jgi:hypothetical protein